ncbi:MAG TPA: alpha/beta fold hydrolase [Candidatus Binataceae bacterium]|nr:alpha/beta fold hydrolase [Candidatus Binataceae bacterium]
MNLVHSAFEPSSEGPHPTIIAMHGWGSNALDLLGLAPYIAGGRFLAVCPQGPVEVPIGAIRGYGWFPLTMGAPPDPEKIDVAVVEAERFIEAALERYPVNRRKLVLLGFSQGGVMAFRLAFRHPEKYSALVAISTWFPPELKDGVNVDAIRQLPTLLQHGRADDMIEIARARQSVEHLRELRIPLTYREYDCGHEITASGLDDLSEFLDSKVLSPILHA